MNNKIIDKCPVCGGARRGCDFNYEGFTPPGCNSECEGYCITRCCLSPKEATEYKKSILEGKK